MSLDIIKEIAKLLKEDVQLEIKNKEFVPSIDDEINEIVHREKTWLNDAWAIIICNQNDSYHWDKWGATDLEYLLNQTLILLQKAKNSNSSFYNHLKSFLKEEISES